MGIIEFSRLERNGFDHDTFYEVMLLYFIHDDVFPQWRITNTVEDSWNNNNEILGGAGLQSFEEVHHNTIRVI